MLEAKDGVLFDDGQIVNTIKADMLARKYGFVWAEHLVKALTFKQFRRKGLSEMRPYIKGEDLTGISVSDQDHPETDMGMIARNPKNHLDQWYVARKYFEENLEEVK